MQKRHHRVLMILVVLGLVLMGGCIKKSETNTVKKVDKKLTAQDILGNPEYPAISFGAYRTDSRRVQPTIPQLKEDLRILEAMDIKILRTYNVHFPHVVNLLKAITEIKQEDPDFEMYIMLGAWIDCKNAWTGFEPDHHNESERNETEINRAVELANTYPDIIKIIAVGNEAMVKWAADYYVQPWIILKWVRHLQDLKDRGELSPDIWITSSDNFASWGGGGLEYHVPELDSLIDAVDYISLHTYPMHDTHYNPVFWGVDSAYANESKAKQIDHVMEKSLQYAKDQYNAVKKYVESRGFDKEIHIGETGWASHSNGHYGDEGSRAADEYKAGLYYRKMRDWCRSEKIACFYFEAFDEPWKDSANPGGSENHFGLFTVEGKAKYAIWPLVEKGVFEGLTRDGHKIEKSFDGSREDLINQIKSPPPAFHIHNH